MREPLSLATRPADRSGFRLALALEIEVIRARRDVALARAAGDSTQLTTAQIVLARLRQVSRTSRELVR